MTTNLPLPALHTVCLTGDLTEGVPEDNATRGLLHSCICCCCLRGGTRWVSAGGWEAKRGGQNDMRLWRPTLNIQFSMEGTVVGCLQSLCILCRFQAIKSRACNCPAQP